MNTVAKFYIGVDVSKKHLDIFIHPKNEYFRVTNDLKGILDFQKKIINLNIERIVCEASGGYEHLMIQKLQKLNYDVWRVEGSRIKAFIRSEGIKSKNDKQDAKLIALFAAQKNPKNKPYKTSTKEFHLRELVRRKDDLIGMISSEKTRFKQAYDSYCQENIFKTMTFLENELKEIRLKIQKIIELDELFNKKFNIAISMPGIGKETASALIAELPELGTATKTEIAALTGLAPYTRESGSYKGKAYISQGRVLIRKAIYMAALTASHHNSVFKEFYQKLRNAGKAAKVAIIAVARKMIVAINAMFKNNKTWKTA